MKKVLIIGNDPTINKIDFTKLNPDVITVGTNRAWLKLIPNYLFFHDTKIFQELDSNPDKLNDLKSNSKIIASDWLTHQCRVHKKTVPSYVKIYNRTDKYKYVDCVTTSIDILNRYVFHKKDTIYYIAGVSLTWKNPSHFWKVNPDPNVGNLQSEEWYKPRFNKSLGNFMTLKKQGFNIVSVTPESKINKLFRYENVANLYI